MATNSSPSVKKRRTSLPPRRGQIKVQIFESFKEKVVSTASKVAKALRICGRQGSARCRTAASASSPSSADENPNIPRERAAFSTH